MGSTHMASPRSQWRGGGGLGCRWAPGPDALGLYPARAASSWDRCCREEHPISGNRPFDTNKQIRTAQPRNRLHRGETCEIPRALPRVGCSEEEPFREAHPHTAQPYVGPVACKRMWRSPWPSQGPAVPEKRETSRHGPAMYDQWPACGLEERPAVVSTPPRKHTAGMGLVKK